MRISIDRDDPGFENYEKLKEQDIKVLFDGEEMPPQFLVTADEDEGIVIALLRNPDGTCWLDDSGKPTRIPLYGPVEIKVAERPYDAAEETRRHIDAVRGNLAAIIEELHARGQVHDESKFSTEEAPYLQKIGELSRSEGKVAYGTPAYEERKKLIEPMLLHHYTVNDHHPEHHLLGVADMTLPMIVEMFCDWVAAAAARDPDGVMNLSFSIEKYEIGPTLAAVLKNTAGTMGIKWK